MTKDWGLVLENVKEWLRKEQERQKGQHASFSDQKHDSLLLRWRQTGASQHIIHASTDRRAFLKKKKMCAFLQRTWMEELSLLSINTACVYSWPFVAWRVRRGLMLYQISHRKEAQMGVRAAFYQTPSCSDPDLSFCFSGRQVCSKDDLWPGPPLLPYVLWRNTPAAGQYLCDSVKREMSEKMLTSVLE